ncbi:MAG: hypothetical protein ACR2FX_11215 [Chthoniobacterales bacterium]
MSNDDIDWSLTTWEGSRREQLRRWSELTMDEILAAQEEMAGLADDMRSAPVMREDPPPGVNNSSSLTSNT